MSTIEPRLGIAYHFFNEEATRYEIYDGVREVYSGPLSMATDRMVWNVTKDKVVERMAVITALHSKPLRLLPGHRGAGRERDPRRRLWHRHAGGAARRHEQDSRAGRQEEVARVLFDVTVHSLTSIDLVHATAT